MNNAIINSAIEQNDIGSAEDVIRAMWQHMTGEQRSMFLLSCCRLDLVAQLNHERETVLVDAINKGGYVVTEEDGRWIWENGDTSCLDFGLDYDTGDDAIIAAYERMTHQTYEP